MLIPAGTFLAGGLNLSLDGRPFEAYLPAYYLAMYPVTNAQYKNSLTQRAGSHRVQEVIARTHSFMLCRYQAGVSL